MLTVQLDRTGNKIRILDDDRQVAFNQLSGTEEVVVNASLAEGDTLVLDYANGLFAVPVTFNKGLTVTSARVVTTGGTASVDASQSDRAITADVGLNTTVVTFAGGGGLTVRRTVSAVTGTAFDDTFVDNTNISLLTLAGLGGDDVYQLDPGSTIAITDSGGTDTIGFGGSGDPIVANIGTTGTTVTDQNGTVTFAGTVDAVIGTAGADTFVDDTSISLLTLDGGLGDDVYLLDPGSTIAITDSGGTDTIGFGGSGDPIVANIGTTGTTVTDQNGTVTFAGTVDAVIGTAGADTFVDDTSISLLTLDGGLGDDTYDLQPGSSIVVFEAGGRDSIKLNRARYAVRANLSAGEIFDTNGNSVMIRSGSVENLDGTVFSDTITGSAADNILYGGTGDDILDGGAGNDTYILTPGGNDTIIDSAGSDVVDFSRTTGTGVNVDLSRTNGSAQNIAPGATLALSGVVETVIGTNQADILSGGAGDDVLVGLGGDDRLQGQSGNDILLGGSGDDDLNGGSGRDILVGGLGTDRLNAGSDEDILIAGFTAYDVAMVGPVPGTPTDQVNLAAWSAIHGVWVGPGDAATRARTINTDTTYRLRATGETQTVFDDGAADTLTGSQSTDWYFANLGTGLDIITDKDDTEFFNDDIP